MSTRRENTWSPQNVESSNTRPPAGLLTQYAETETVKEAASIGTRLSRFVS
jgi:hypothetical protein